jgi:polar amino acid transport system ATP-binding protein
VEKKSKNGIVMLKISGLSKSFTDTCILDNINLEVQSVKILGLAGPSGSGKSTLLRCIQKLEKPDRGTIECTCRVGFMFQDFQLFPHMTVLKNLVYAPVLKNRKNKKKHIDRAIQLLEKLGIDDKANKYPNTLSGGQKQRVALARSLMMNPDILLCDEPTSGLDVTTISDVAALLQNVNKLGLTIIVASHDLDFLVKISDRIILLKCGRIIADLLPNQHPNPAEVVQNYLSNIV